MINSLTISVFRFKIWSIRCFVQRRNAFQSLCHRFQISFKQFVNKTQISLQFRFHVFYSEIINLSQNNYNIIAEHSLISLLNYLQSLFQKTKKSCDAIDDDFDQKFQKTIIKFLDFLLLSEAINYFFSQIENRNVLFDLLKLRTRIQKNDLNYQHYRSLSQFVIKKTFDVDIWNAVFDFIIEIFWTIFFTNVLCFFRWYSHYVFICFAAKRRANSQINENKSVWTN